MMILSLFAIAGALSPAGDARAQQDERIGGVDVHLQADSATGADLGFAVLRPDGGSVDGALVWACGGRPSGLAAGVHLRWRDSAGPRVAWRFDRDAPDTTVLRTGQAVLELLGNQDAAAVTRRARAAQRLALQVLDGPGAEYAYSLAGLDSALNRLGCAQPAEPGAGRAGLGTLQSLIQVRDEPDTTVIKGLGVFTGSRPRNTADFQRRLARNYPPLLRDAGVTGGVLMLFRVLEDGRVDSASVRIAHSTQEQFEAPATRALRALTFHPATVNGRPVKVWNHLPIQFVVADGVGAVPHLTPQSMMAMVEQVARDYPPLLRDAGVEGQVVLRFRVLASGRVDETSIQVVSATHDVFRDIAVRAAGRLRYTLRPPPADGEARDEVWVTETIRFLSRG